MFLAPLCTRTGGFLLLTGDDSDLTSQMISFTQEECGGLNHHQLYQLNRDTSALDNGTSVLLPVSQLHSRLWW